MTVWFRVNKENSPLNTDDDHSIMCHADKELDKLCKKLKVAKISDFFDGSAMAADFADEGADVEVEAGWHDPKAGLATVEALLKFLDENPKELTFKDKSKAHWRETLVSELTDAKAFLEKAVSAKVRFHFQLVS